MFKREFKINFKSFMIWTSILVVLFVLVFLLYSTFIKSDNIDNINELLKVFPEDVLKIFNLDITRIDTAFGWMETEGFMFVLLIMGIYSSLLGSNILLKEENDKTIEYLSSLPIKRNDIIFNKILAGIIYVILMPIILGITNFIVLSIIEEFNTKLFILLSLTPILSNISLFSISLFISTFSHKSKKVLPISIGIVFISYFLQVFSQMSESVDFFKYFSVYTLSDTRSIILNNTMSIYTVIFSIIISGVFISLSFIKYNKKELV